MAVDNLRITPTKLNTMKKYILITGLMLLTLNVLHAQLYFTTTGFAGFYSKTPFEDIKAENNQVYAVIDPSKKSIAFSMLLNGFVFTKELMQEHFNENYIESDKYPKATFTGAYADGPLPRKDGVYKVLVKGRLSLHNISRDIEVPATLEMTGGRLKGEAEFRLKPEDFNIRIPSLVRDKISAEMTVKVRIDCGAAK